jgi:NADPH2:quinone reductase
MGMEAICVNRYGGPDALVPTELPPPEPGPGEVRVDLVATGVNFVETYQRSGRYPVPLPFVPGAEGAGTVGAIGPGVDSLQIGDRVASVDLRGSYAEQAVVPADRVVPLPDGVDEATAAAAMLQGMTAHYLLFDSYPVGPGDTVLVHAAAGGMSLLLTQIAVNLGARVIGTVSTEEKERLAREAGAAEVIRYTEQDVETEVRRITGGEGVAATYDGVGRDTFESSLASLRRRGTLVLYGAASGLVPPFDPQRLQAAGSVYLTRPTLAHYIVDRAELAARAWDVLRWIADGTVSIRIHRRYPLREARQAHEDLQARRTTGKLLLVPPAVAP